MAVATTFNGFVNDQGGQVVNVTNPAYGARGDTVRSPSGGAITAASTTFTSSATGVAFGHSDIGKVVTVQGAGLSGAVLSTTITAVLSPAQVTLGDPALTTVSNAEFSYGTDDTVALVAALTAAGLRTTVLVPAGIYTIRGSSYAGDSSGGNQLHLKSAGGLRGHGGRGANSVFLCADETAGVLAIASACYEGFMVDGNNIATTPLWNGIIEGPDSAGTTGGVGEPTGGLPTGPPTGVVDGYGISYATFIDVWATRSAGNGWAIIYSQNNTYYDCGTTDHAGDGLYIDGGAGGLDFFNFYERGSKGYAIHGDALVPAATGYATNVSDMRFFGGTLDSDPNRQGMSKVYLRFAFDWRFEHTKIVGTNLSGPTVHLDQVQAYGLDFFGCWIWATPKGTNPGNACIQIDGIAPYNNSYVFSFMDGCYFGSGDNSVYIGSSNEYYLYSGRGWLGDETTYGPVTSSALPASAAVVSAPDVVLPDANVLLSGRTGSWQLASLASGWTGSVYYRVMAEGWVQMKGSAQSGAGAAGTLFTLPLGYRPLGGGPSEGGDTYHATVAIDNGTGSTPGVGLVTIEKATSIENGDNTNTNPGAVVFGTLPGGGSLTAGSAVHLDGVFFPIRGDLGTYW